VPVAVWHVLGQSSNELLDRISSFHPQLLFPVFRPKLEFPIVDLHETMLRNGGPPNVAARVLQEMPHRLEIVNVDAPPTFVLHLQDRS
jgi:hypothetical protein